MVAAPRELRTRGRASADSIRRDRADRPARSARRCSARAQSDFARTRRDGAHATHTDGRGGRGASGARGGNPGLRAGRSGRRRARSRAGSKWRVKRSVAPGLPKRAAARRAPARHGWRGRRSIPTARWRRQPRPEGIRESSRAGSAIRRFWAPGFSPTIPVQPPRPGLARRSSGCGLCREAVMGLRRMTPAKPQPARSADRSAMIPGADAGIIVIDRHGNLGYAHNADSMEVAMFDPERGLRYERVRPNRTSPSRT